MILLKLIVLILLLIFIWIKVKYKFWSIQPAFHVYNIYYWFLYSGIINNDLPKKNRYYDSNIVTNKTVINKDICDFLTKWFLNSKKIKYSPKVDHVKAYFDCDYNSFTSSLTRNNNLVGLITSRQIEVYINNHMMLCYYVDYLCIDLAYRNKYLAPKLIQTHIYNQRHKNDLPVIVFKREKALSIIVPIVIYITYGFVVYNWKKTNLVTVSKLSSSNIREILEKINFKFKILPIMSVLIDLIDKDVIKIYGVVFNSDIKALYFFRDPDCVVNNKSCIECFASINLSLTEEQFVSGFTNVVVDINKEFLWIENLSHNKSLIKSIIENNHTNFICPMAYYFYNWASTPYLEKDVFIMC